MPTVRKQHKQHLEDVLLLTVWCCPIRKERVNAWAQHATKYRQLTGKIDDRPPLGVTRIDFVAGHLDILDRKFGTLLTFHGLMATVAALYLNIAQPHPLIDLSFSFWIFWFFWALTTFLCLLNMARLTWGDLGAEQLEDAEKEQVAALIRSVVTRTASFRLAVLLTLGGLLSLMFAIVAPTQLTHGRANNDTAQPSPSVLVETVGPSTPVMVVTPRESYKSGH